MKIADALFTTSCQHLATDVGPTRILDYNNVQDYTFLIIAILFCSTLTRSTFGFGDAIVAMPLLVTFLAMNQARPLVACVSVTTSSLILARDWRAIHFSSSWKITVSAIAGLFVGFYGVEYLDERLVKGILATIILLFATWRLTKPQTLTLHTDRSIWFFGACAGVLSGAYNVPGPPLVIFGTLRRWEPSQFRATFQSTTFPLGIVLVLGHGYAGNLTMEVLRQYLCVLPAVVIAVVLGRMLHVRVRGQSFEKYIFGILIIVGVFLVLQALDISP